jgi:hypothetical protein
LKGKYFIKIKHGKLVNLNFKNHFFKGSQFIDEKIKETTIVEIVTPEYSKEM